MLKLLLSTAVAMGAAAVATPALAVTDVVDAPTGYFVPDDSLKYDSTYWRGNGQDWDWQHGAISDTIVTASLNIAAFDVDYDGTSSGELDNIYAYDAGGANDWVLLGALTGTNDAWDYGNSFTLGSNFYDDIATGLKVQIRIDQNARGWFVTLGKSALSVNGGILPPPTPGGVPEPATWALMILGFGAVGGALRRRQAKVAFA